MIWQETSGTPSSVEIMTSVMSVERVPSQFQATSESSSI